MVTLGNLLVDEGDAVPQFFGNEGDPLLGGLPVDAQFGTPALGVELNQVVSPPLFPREFEFGVQVDEYIGDREAKTGSAGGEFTLVLCVFHRGFRRRRLVLGFLWFVCGGFFRCCLDVSALIFRFLFLCVGVL